MEIVLDSAPIAETTIPAPIVGAIDGGTETANEGSDDIMIADPQLAALASLSKSVYKSEEPMKEALKELSDKFEKPLKEQYAKTKGKNGVVTTPKPTNGIAKPIEVVKPAETPATKPEEGAVKPTIQKAGKLFQKPTVEIPKAAAEEKKYYISEEADRVLTERIKDKVGDFKDLQSFFDERLPGMRQIVSKAKEHETKFNTIQDQINNAPEPIRQMLVASAKDDLVGAREAAQRFLNYVDYSKPFADQAKVAVQALMPKLNTTDPNGKDYYDLDDKEDAKAQNLKIIAEDLFNKEKKDTEARVKDNQDRYEKLQGKATSVLTSSIQKLNDSLPDDFPQKVAFMKDVDRTWRSTDGIDSIFYDKEGVPVEDAAERSFFAIHGKSIVAWYENALYEAEMEKQNLIASGVGKSAVAPTNNRNYVSGASNNLVEETRKNIRPVKSRIQPA